MTSGATHHPVRIKRVYLPPDSADGQRVLVDRLWPRGLTKEKAAVAVWLKDVAPSTELRHWFHHEAARWEEFEARYVAELASNPAVDELRALIDGGPVTLLYGAHDEKQNQAVVLMRYLSETSSSP